ATASTASAAAASAASTAAAAAVATAAAPSAASPPADPASAPLDERVQALKGEVIALERDLLVLEEELLYPAGTQVAVFVSMDVGRLFELESVQLQLDDKPVAMHLYTPLEVQALHRGGMQRLFMGNLKTGHHRLTAYFTGQGPHDRDYRRGATFEFDKGTEPRYIELRIRDLQAKLQPEFETKVWQ
ncbi:MAG: AraC family transcriptional regulator, partial [Burkholderiales bacterium]|nr:AraC family transcriptional regulator [Burkholderiales bacterium]